MTTVYAEHEEKGNKNNSEMSELEERYQEIIATIKKTRPPKKKMKHMTQETMQKIPQQMQEQKALLLKMQNKSLKGEARSASAKMTTDVTPQQHLKLEAQLVDTVAHETGSGSKKRSSKDDEQRGFAAALEAEGTLVDTVLHKTEGSNTLRSSETDNPWCGSAHLEHRRSDGWTSTLRGKDEEKNCG